MSNYLHLTFSACLALVAINLVVVLAADIYADIQERKNAEIECQ